MRPERDGGAPWKRAWKDIAEEAETFLLSSLPAVISFDLAASGAFFLFCLVLIWQRRGFRVRPAAAMASTSLPALRDRSVMVQPPLLVKHWGGGGCFQTLGWKVDKTQTLGVSRLLPLRKLFPSLSLSLRLFSLSRKTSLLLSFFLLSPLSSPSFLLFHSLPSLLSLARTRVLRERRRRKIKFLSPSLPPEFLSLSLSLSIYLSISFSPSLSLFSLSPLSLRIPFLSLLLSLSPFPYLSSRLLATEIASIAREAGGGKSSSPPPLSILLWLYDVAGRPRFS